MGFSQDEQRLPPLSKTFDPGDLLNILDLEAKVLFVPGHTLGLCLFYFPKMQWLFTSDLIFSLGCGRVFEGTHQQMFESLQVVSKLPHETLLFCSHEYTLSNLEFARATLPDDKSLKEIEPTICELRQKKLPTVPTSLGFEKAHNPFLRCNDPSIRKSLNMLDTQDWEVFSRLRHLKDNF